MADIVQMNVAKYFEMRGLMELISKYKRGSPLPTLGPSLPCSTPSNDSSPFSATSKYNPGKFIGIPEALYSKETYEFMGLTKKAASEVWERYNSRDPDMSDSFLQFAQYYVQMNNEPDAYTESDNWDVCMENMGVTKALREAILMPAYEDLRYTQSAKYWVIDTFEMRFGSLEILAEEMRGSVHVNQQKAYSLSSGGTSTLSSSNLIPLSASSSPIALGKAGKQKQNKNQQKRREGQRKQHRKQKWKHQPPYHLGLLQFGKL